MVSNETRTRKKVRAYTLTRRPGDSFSARPAAIAAQSSAVPVAERRLKVNLASSGVGLAATGGVFSTALCKYGTSQTWTKSVFSAPLIAGSPHKNTNTERKIHGSHAFHAGPRGSSADSIA